ncbi:MAG: hypothetical protein EA356_08620 [Geminicoccaceae bacterium]|nr:MAG: hypothetical protein EA356_08620 [Geminicoccaceae bacterium]
MPAMGKSEMEAIHPLKFAPSYRWFLLQILFNMLRNASTKKFPRADFFCKTLSMKLAAASTLRSSRGYTGEGGGSLATTVFGVAMMGLR